MPRHRDADPSPAAIAMRQHRQRRRDAERAAVAAAIPASSRARRPEPWPAEDAQRDEAERAKAVHDGRRAAMAAERERLAVEQERGRLVTREHLRDQVRQLTDLYVVGLAELVTAAIAVLPAEQQPVARHKLNVEVTALRQRLVDRIRAASTARPAP